MTLKLSAEITHSSDNTILSYGVSCTAMDLTPSVKWYTISYISQEGNIMQHIDNITIHGRHVERGTELSIRGNGRMKFLYMVKNGNREWIDLIDRHRKFRSFRIDDVKRVHIKSKLR